MLQERMPHTEGGKEVGEVRVGVREGTSEVKVNHMPWFHGKISREVAEKLLTPRTDGLFLVRGHGATWCWGWCWCWCWWLDWCWGWWGETGLVGRLGVKFEYVDGTALTAREQVLVPGTVLQ